MLYKISSFVILASLLSHSSAFAMGRKKTEPTKAQPEIHGLYEDSRIIALKSGGFAVWNNSSSWFTGVSSLQILDPQGNITASKSDLHISMDFHSIDADHGANGGPMMVSAGQMAEMSDGTIVLLGNGSQSCNFELLSQDGSIKAVSPDWGLQVIGPYDKDFCEGSFSLDSSGSVLTVSAGITHEKPNSKATELDLANGFNMIITDRGVVRSFDSNGKMLGEQQLSEIPPQVLLPTSTQQSAVGLDGTVVSVGYDLVIEKAKH